MRKNSKKSIGPASVIAASLSPFHLEADRSARGITLSVGGARAISDLTPGSVSLRLRFGTLCVRGRELSLAIYENSTAEIAGIIETVEFIYAKA